MDSLEKINRWYQSWCDDLWEHDYGVEIRSCDNPGWWVKIDLSGTDLEKREFVEVAEGVDEERHPMTNRWFNCYVKDKVFNGACDPSQLNRIFDSFCEWADL